MNGRFVAVFVRGDDSRGRTRRIVYADIVTVKFADSH